MKRTIAIFFAVLMTVTLLTGCSGTDTNVSTTPNGTVNGTEPDNRPDRVPVDPNPDVQPDMPNQDREETGSVPNTQQRPDNSDTQTTEQYDGSIGQDIADAADDAMDGVKDAVEDVTGPRAANRSGRGMIGGR